MTDRCPDLRDFFDRHEPIKTGHQRVSERERYRQVARIASINVMIAGVPKAGGLQDRLGQLLHEERHSIGFDKDFLQQILGKVFPPLSLNTGEVLRLLDKRGGVHHR